MKAMILAAGLGTRLMPFSRHTPKPLFTLNRRPLLEVILDRLREAGCHAVIVNTHHLHEQIETLVRHYRGMVVHTCYEPEILGTGGAIRNTAAFWIDEPLLVVNADVVTDIDFKSVYRFHHRHDHPVTLVMHDHPDFNSVWVDRENRVVGFHADAVRNPTCRKMAFTGIHVLDHRVLNYLPPVGPAHIIDGYAAMIDAGEPIQSLIVRNHYWRDIGTPAAYAAAAFDHMAPAAFALAHGNPPREPIQRHALQGDGSDRRWCRLAAGPATLIMADHGIRPRIFGQQEVDAFVAIGNHLYAQGAAVPRIYLHDPFSGLVFMEDLGDTRLQDLAVAGRQSPEGSPRLYRRVIDQWLDMAILGAQGFDTAWTHQTARYDRSLILDRECRYFVEAFLNGYLGRADRYAHLANEFEALADQILRFECSGFMHRDLQSRNIMISNGRIGFIDFQGGRLGPLQYDLASLLIDPYAALCPGLQRDLRIYAARRLHHRTGADIERFLKGYAYCAIARNLQVLGAFGYLTRVKGKSFFEAFIPNALSSLHTQLNAAPDVHLPRLAALLATLDPHSQSNPKEVRHATHQCHD